MSPVFYLVLKSLIKCFMSPVFYLVYNNELTERYWGLGLHASKVTNYYYVKRTCISVMILSFADSFMVPISHENQD